jgi:hypothetical protein
VSAQAEEFKRTKRNYKPYTKQKIMTTETIEQRNELIQNVIDRLLYLPEKDLVEYETYLNRLTAVYRIPMEVKNGVRIYETIKNL